jgi:16S rRNA (cytosine967-C5)-methyltransferase
VLDRLEDGTSHSSRELARLGGALADERDLRLATELVYGTLRHRSEIDFFLEHLSGRPLDRIAPALLSPLRTALHQILHLDRIPDSAAVNEAVRMARQAAGARAAGFVNAVLRAACRRRSELRLPAGEGDPVGDLALAHSVPSWMVARWWERLGDRETRALLAVLQQPAPLSLWVHPLRTSPGELAADLAADGVIAEISPILPGAMRVTRGQPQRSRAFQEGRCYLQDEASQAIPLLVGARPREILADFCAAPGGKSFSLACAVTSGGWVLAIDRAASRLRLLQENLARLGLGNVLPVVADLEREPPLRSMLPGVLLDAPCSGTGILRRQPEIRWRRTAADLVPLVRRQTALLDSAAGIVAPGGRLVYSVCSLEREEGEDRIEEFVANHPEFVRADARDYLPGTLRDACTSSGYLRTWPHRHGTDGFFAAVLHRGGAGPGPGDS